MERLPRPYRASMSDETEQAPAPPCHQLWLTEAATAERLNMSRKWLQKQRLHGGALRFAKFGGAIRYSVADIEEFERESLRRSTSDSGAPCRR